MPTPDLQALIELSEKATAGPWIATVAVSDGGGWKNPQQFVTIGNESEEKLVAHYETSFSEYPADSENEANAAFIAALVNWFRANHSTLTAPTLPGAGGGDGYRYALQSVLRHIEEGGAGWESTAERLIRSALSGETK